ncbi:hypothetical protein BDL97_17G079600 [Sphagnum fallax]|nr:hypothetical protein BDL97_17G079600 [Sphagnum fallax]
MGSSSSEAGDEDRISDGVRSDAGVVVVDLTDAGSTALAHKRKRARGEFPWAHTHGWTKGDPLAQKGKRQCIHCKKWFSSKTNCSGWKAHLSSKHSLSQAGSDKASSAPDHVTHKYENVVVDFVIGGDISLRAAGGKRFKELLQSLTNGYSPPSTRTILRRIVELYLIARPLLVAFFSSLTVAISLTLDGWSNRNLKGFYVVTVHWIDTVTAKSKSLLLTIIDVASGRGVGVRVAKALFEHLKGMGLNVLPKLLNVVSDNSSDAIAAVKHMFQLINATVGYEQMRPCNHVRCADHSGQLAVLKVLVRIKDINAQLRQALVCIRRSKTMRQAYRREADLAGFASKEPPHQDCPTRWNSTHEMGSDAFNKRVPLDHIMNLYNDTIGVDVMSDEQWERIAVVTTFLHPPRQVMESLAADRKTSLDLVSASITHLIKHCENGKTTFKDIDQDLTTAGMKAKLQQYEKLLVQEPAIVQNVGDEIGNEVEKYLSLGVVTSSSFIDVMEWWTTRKDVFPAHYQMAADYLGTPATSTPSERMNSMAGHEFIAAR